MGFYIFKWQIEEHSVDDYMGCINRIVNSANGFKIIEFNKFKNYVVDNANCSYNNRNDWGYYVEEITKEEYNKLNHSKDREKQILKLFRLKTKERNNG